MASAVEREAADSALCRSLAINLINSPGFCSPLIHLKSEYRLFRERTYFVLLEPKLFSQLQTWDKNHVLNNLEFEYHYFLQISVTERKQKIYLRAQILKVLVFF
jgi:hypothetical protein